MVSTYLKSYISAMLGLPLLVFALIYQCLSKSLLWQSQVLKFTEIILKYLEDDATTWRSVFWTANRSIGYSPLYIYYELLTVLLPFDPPTQKELLQIVLYTVSYYTNWCGLSPTVSLVHGTQYVCHTLWLVLFYFRWMLCYSCLKHFVHQNISYTLPI